MNNMGNKFIYVTDESVKDDLESKGYKLFKESEDQRYWIFFNNNKLNFDLNTSDVMFSNNIIF